MSITKGLALAACSTMALGFGCTGFAASELMEEVIVTAQKREQNLQDTPISVTAFTAGAIEAAALALTIARGVVPPTIHHSQTDSECDLRMPLLGKAW